MAIHSTATASVPDTQASFVETNQKGQIDPIALDCERGRKFKVLPCSQAPRIRANFLSFPWSFLKMWPNPMLQTYQLFSLKSGADLKSFFHRECVFSVKACFYRPTPESLQQSQVEALDKEDSNAPAQSRTFFLPRCSPRSLGTSPENSCTVKGMS